MIEYGLNTLLALFQRAIVLVCILSISASYGADEFSLTQEVKSEVIDSVIEQLENRYVLPSRGRIAAEELQHRFDTGYFDNITEAQIFANRIIGVLDVISDWHLWVNFYGEPIPSDYDYYESLEDEQTHAVMRRRNLGIEKVDRLAGNIGYIEFRSFSYLEGESEQALAHAMALLENTSGLIIDLRRNGGGSPDMVQLASSYFLDPDHHIGSIEYRENDRSEQVYTRSQVQGPHYGTEKPIKILISKGTFSGAEAFAYTLQARDRAVLVGEKTLGGAHPTEQVRLHEHFMMGVPIARSIDAVTQSNWQYVGVRPEHEIDQNDSLQFAQRLMLEKLMESETDPVIMQELSNSLSQLKE